MIVDADRIITFINDPFLSLLDLTREQVINRHITTIRGVTPDTEGLEAAFVAAAESGEVKEMIRFSGEERIFLRRCVPVTLETGAAGTAVIMEELTAQIRAEQALHEQENQLAEVIENLQDVYYRTDLEDTLIYASRQALPILGYDSGNQMLGRAASSFWAEPEKRKKFVNLVRKRGAINDFETTLIRGDGSSVPVSISSHLRFTRDGEVLGLGGTIRDITRRKQNEEKIRVLSAHNHAMIDQVPLVALQFDETGALASCNDLLIAKTGWTRNQVLGRDWHLHLVPKETGDLGLTLLDVARGARRDWTGPVLTAGGRVLQIRWTCLMLYDEQHQFAGSTCLGEEVTDQRLLAGLLFKTGEQYRDLVETIPYPTVLIDADWTVTRANREFTTALQYTVPERPKKLTLLSIFSPESRPAVTALLNQEAGHGTGMAIRGDGTAISVMVRSGPCRGDGPRVLMLMTGQEPPGDQN